MNRRRIIAAFLLSPLAGALYVVAVIVFEKRLWNQLTDILGLASMVLLFAIIGYVAEGALGIPLLYLFRRVNRLTLPWFLLGGFVIGIVVSIVISIFFGAADNPLGFAIFYCIAPAIISTTVFWFIGWAADNKALQLTAR
jgi:hypothetical protein